TSCRSASPRSSSRTSSRSSTPWRRWSRRRPSASASPTRSTTSSRWARTTERPGASHAGRFERRAGPFPCRSPIQLKKGLAAARAFNRGVDLLSALLRVVILLMAAAIFVIIVATVITRYGFNYVVSWSEEVPRYLLIWISFLGAAVCVDLKDHIAFDYLYKRFPRRLRTAVQFLINAAIFAFGYIML